MKIQKNSSTVSPILGILYINKKFNNSGISQRSDKEISVRASTKSNICVNTSKSL